MLAGDAVIIPLLRDQLPKHLTDRIIDILRLDITTPEHEILKATTEALREHDDETDAQQVRHLLDQYRSHQETNPVPGAFGKEPSPAPARAPKDVKATRH